MFIEHWIYVGYDSRFWGYDDEEEKDTSPHGEHILKEKVGNKINEWIIRRTTVKKNKGEQMDGEYCFT